jgi:hypothetical protein
LRIDDWNPAKPMFLHGAFTFLYILTFAASHWIRADEISQSSYLWDLTRWQSLNSTGHDQ